MPPENCPTRLRRTFHRLTERRPASTAAASGLPCSTLFNTEDYDRIRNHTAIYVLVTAHRPACTAAAQRPALQNNTLLTPTQNLLAGAGEIVERMHSMMDGWMAVSTATFFAAVRFSAQGSRQGTGVTRFHPKHAGRRDTSHVDT